MAQVVGALRQGIQDGVQAGLEVAQPGYSLQAHFDGPGLTVKQTMKGCFKECCGCEDTSEYRIADYVGVSEAGENAPGSVPYKLYALEESSACCRCCICNVLGLTSGRALTINVSQFNAQDTEQTGGECRGRGGAPVVKYQKPCSCPVCVRIPTDDGYIPIPCCCNLPRLESYDMKGRFLGASEYLCDCYCCVPKWKVTDSKGNYAFHVRPDVCCCGCCVKCRCDGKKGGCFYEPMILRNPTTREPIMGNHTDPASVVKVWSGLKKECCSEADNFAVLYPPGITTDMKANLLGLTFLVDYTVYEGNQ